MKPLRNRDESMKQPRFFAVFGGIGLSWRRFPNLMRQTQKVFSRDLAALLKGKSGCRRRRRKALSLILRLTGVTNPKM
jgi:hypothetical protein